VNNPQIASARRSQARLDALRGTRLLDAPTTEALDRLSRLAAQMLEVPVAFLSLVDEERDFYLSHSGFSGELARTRELRGETFCHFGLVSDGPVVIDDTRADPVHRQVPTGESLGVSAYMGIPIRSEEDEILGSFCAIDFKPRRWSMRDREILAGLADAVRAELRLLVMLGENVRRSERADQERRDAEVRARASQQMLNSVSHDLRSPLNSLVLALGTIEATCDHPVARKSMAIARRQAVLMKGLLDDLLDHARITQGTLRLCVEPVDVGRLLRELQEDFAAAAASAGVTLAVADGAALSPVPLDHGRMRHVLNNLLSNAFKFTPRDGRITVEARHTGAELVLEVADTGKGIDPEAASHVFEPYWQGGDTQGRAGIGLGLHIARHIVELHGGRITVAPTPGGGATFAIRLPDPKGTEVRQRLDLPVA
jgi:signal transduction histidine kinase